MDTEHEIRFYRASEKPYGMFSNLYRRPIQFEGELFPTSEHAYQAGKARKAEVRKWLMAAPSPALLAMAAHGLYYWDVTPGWSKIKFDRMRSVLRAKFTQHADLRDLLLSTGNAVLIETATTDNEVNRLWGQVCLNVSSVLKQSKGLCSETYIKSLESTAQSPRICSPYSSINWSPRRGFVAGKGKTGQILYTSSVNR